MVVAKKAMRGRGKKELCDAYKVLVLQDKTYLEIFSMHTANTIMPYP
jgi:hypothetical protein